jgi:hypothetical protein
VALPVPVQYAVGHKPSDLQWDQRKANQRFSNSKAKDEALAQYKQVLKGLSDGVIVFKDICAVGEIKTGNKNTTKNHNHNDHNDSYYLVGMPKVG